MSMTCHEEKICKYCCYYKHEQKNLRCQLSKKRITPYNFCEYFKYKIK